MSPVAWCPSHAARRMVSVACCASHGVCCVCDLFRRLHVRRQHSEDVPHEGLQRMRRRRHLAAGAGTPDRRSIDSCACERARTRRGRDRSGLCSRSVDRRRYLHAAMISDSEWSSRYWCLGALVMLLSTSGRYCNTDNCLSRSPGPVLRRSVPLVRSSVPLLRLSVPLLRLSVPLLRLSVPVVRISVPLVRRHQYPYCDYQYPYCDYQYPYCEYQYPYCDY